MKPFVRPSVKRVNCEKTKETSAYIFTLYERTIILVFNTKNGWWRWSPSTWNFGPNWPRWGKKRRFSIDIHS